MNCAIISRLSPRDTHLFNESLRNNIAIAKPDASDREIDHAVAEAALTDFIEIAARWPRHDRW